MNDHLSASSGLRWSRSKRGGTGIVRGYEVRSNAAWVYFWFERSITPAWGLFGGQEGRAKPSVTIQSLTGESVELLKVNAKQLQYGTVVTGYTGGGGGFGHPFDRDLAEVLADVMNEYVSVTAAKRDYGVVIHQGTMELDVANLVGDIARLRLRSTAGSRSFRVVVVRVKIVFSYIEIIF
ncbi:hydantoinase B/oxoprolinase family protein [Alicyclobacillus suci]|uniref:hydantoinase B/oxoprolinase family protein n=1 Tax=Alicyclobacillus suci TaxID=2816080 RepID=UPI0011BE0180|nr:hydantoinase B/oxoprolinase family protein [Alicyclobacillus suci]